jgi:probable selenium-dependent hydroxylase accessory protein YqeC
MNIFSVKGGMVKKCDSLIAALDCALKKEICLVGAGGKTTLLYALADEFAKSGKKTAAATTTHIEIPTGRRWAESLKEARQFLKKGGYAILGKEAAEDKLSYVGDAEYARLYEYFDVLIFEADGAKHLPLKVPAAHEPVILPQADLVIGVMGLDCVGRKIGKVCHRAPLAAELLGKSLDDRIDVFDAAKIINSRRGMQKNVRRKFCAVINKVSCAGDLQTVQEISFLANREIIAMGAKM